MKKRIVFRKGDIVRIKTGKVSKVSKGVREQFFPKNEVIHAEGETFWIDTEPEKTKNTYRVIEKIGNTCWLEDKLEGNFWVFEPELVMVKPSTSLLRQTFGYAVGWTAFYTGLLLMIFGKWVSNWAGIDLDTDEDNVGTDRSALEATMPYKLQMVKYGKLD